MVYRQSIKQEIAKEGGASACNSQSAVSDVGSKKLIILPPSSCVGGEIRRRKFGKNMDDNNNDGTRDASACRENVDGYKLASGVTGKKLIIKPPSSCAGAELERRNCDKDVDNTNNDSCKLASSTDDVKSIGGKSDDCGNEMSLGTDAGSKQDVVDVSDSIDVNEHTASEPMSRKGRKTGKNSAAAAGKKGMDKLC